MFKNYKAMIENKKEMKIKILRSDKGGENFPNDFNTFF